MLYGIKKLLKNAYLYVWLLLIGLIVLLFFVARAESETDFPLTSQKEITVYKTPDCGCCAVYANYMERETDAKIQREVVSDTKLSMKKQEMDIPNDLRSCHTTIVGDYVVEGHIPLEQIEEIIDEEKDWEWIAMPGMPSGSPGMPGRKEPFNIYKLTQDWYEHRKTE